MNISCACTTFIRENCYLLVDEKSGEAALVDPGKYGVDVKSMLEKNNVSRLKYILLTHGHFDHILGAVHAKDDVGGEIAIHEADADCLYDAEKAHAVNAFAKKFVATKADVILKDGDSLFLGETEIKVMHTPGHTLGSVCFIADGKIISGDTFFKGTVGRTDLYGGDMKTLMESVMKISALEGDYEVYPGHNEATTLENERRYNPYF